MCIRTVTCSVTFRYKELLAQVAQGLPTLANVPNPTEAQVIQALFNTAAEASIVTMQNKIEATCYNLGKQAGKRDAAAGMAHSHIHCM
jgi:hypothetical protein